MVKANTPPKDVAVELVDRVMKRGGMDNVSVRLIAAYDLQGILIIYQVIVSYLLRKDQAGAVLAGQVDRSQIEVRTPKLTRIHCEQKSMLSRRK